MRRERTPNIADLVTLADRYGIDGNFLRAELKSGVEDGRLSPPTTFQGADFWFVVETDAWFVRWIREQHGVLQGELAGELGVSQSLMSKWELEGGCPPMQIEMMRDHVRRIAERKSAANAA